MQLIYIASLDAYCKGFDTGERIGRIYGWFDAHGLTVRHNGVKQ